MQNSMIINIKAKYQFSHIIENVTDVSGENPANCCIYQFSWHKGQYFTAHTPCESRHTLLENN